ncbi:MAG: hypothetical protein HC876_02635 [Chloroflexaceae bacterium]|nr:hypothetical protein [Chloroflexaceae bacterium]NJO04505.1 hypothetical protein [Chloroflexaceae bacterium]
MAIIIRPVQGHAQYRAVEQVQRDAWSMEDIEIVPSTLLVTAHKNGGLVVGAFTDDAEPQMVGFLFGFPGLHSDGTIKHCSHQMGVLPAYRDQRLGQRMKLAQREYVQQQGIGLITWTFDPLESRNGNLNLHKLGAICNTYIIDAYGPMRRAGFAELPSDRFQVEWHINSLHVAARVATTADALALQSLLEAGVPIINPPDTRNTFLRPTDSLQTLAGDRLLVAVPPNFQSIRNTDIGLARAWRQHTRYLFQVAFMAGYTAIDLLSDGVQICYLLEKDWRLV